MITILERGVFMTLSQSQANTTYKVKEIVTKDKIKTFLLTLGCYENTELTVISKLSGTVVVNIKDGRYAVDEKIAKNILLYA